MLRAVLARLRMWFDLLIGTVGPRTRQTRPWPRLRAADPPPRLALLVVEGVVA
jgi:hypothetical protein